MLSDASSEHDERCRAEAQTREERQAETLAPEKHEWPGKTPQYLLLKFFSRPLRFLSFMSSQDPIANGALARVIARFLLVTIGPASGPSAGRPVGRKAHNCRPAKGKPG